MPKIYRVSKAGLRLFYKIRHHRGHGIHSPFVFRLITRVVEERSPYHRYIDIQEAVRRNSLIRNKITKYDLLSFRLVNYFNPINILEIGSGVGVNTLCLTAPSCKIKCTCVETSPDKYRKAQSLYYDWKRNITLYNEFMGIDEKQDCIFINLNSYKTDLNWIVCNLLPLVGEDSFVIVKGVRTKKLNEMLWKELKELDSVTASLDLYHEGILFFNPKFYKRNYKISF